MRKEYDFTQGKRGAVLRVPPGKIRITIRLDSDVLQWFKQRAEELDGASYQTLINHALRAYIAGDVESLEETLRRIVREELQNVKRA